MATSAFFFLLLQHLKKGNITSCTQNMLWCLKLVEQRR